MHGSGAWSISGDHGSYHGGWIGASHRERHGAGVAALPADTGRCGNYDGDERGNYDEQADA